MAGAAVRRHNETVLSSLEIGDLVEFPRGSFSHWAVYVGNEMVVHLSYVNDGGTNVTNGCGCYCQGHTNASVRIDNFFNVAGENQARRNNSLDSRRRPFSRAEIVNNALSRLNEGGYNLIWKNCEHFATSCRYGQATSSQSDFWITVGGIVVSAAVGVVSFVGAAALLVFSKIKK